MFVKISGGNCPIALRLVAGLLVGVIWKQSTYTLERWFGAPLKAEYLHMAISVGAPSKAEYLRITMAVEGRFDIRVLTHCSCSRGPFWKQEYLHITVAVGGHL